MNQTPTRSPTGPPLVVVFFPYVAVLLIGPIGLWIGLPALVILNSGLALLVVGRYFGGFIALPLALRFGKRGKTLGIALSIIAFFVYYLMVSAAAAFGRNGALNPYLAAWLPNIVMGTAGALLLLLEER